MEIHLAELIDAEALTSVEITSKKQSIPDLVEEIEIDYERRLQRWQNYFAARSPSSSLPERMVLKAVENDEIVGYIAGHRSTRYSLDSEIQSFYILKEYQRKGIGANLFLRFLEWLIPTGAKSLCVGIEPENHYRAFYLKHGGKHLNPHWIYWDDLMALKHTIQ